MSHLKCLDTDFDITLFLRTMDATDLSTKKNIPNIYSWD